MTRSPRARRRCPRLEAVRPLPSEEATPPVTKMCLVCATDFDSNSPRCGSRAGLRTRRVRRRAPPPGPGSSGRPLPGARAQALAQHRVGKHREHGPGQRRHVPARHEHGRVADDPAGAADVGGDDRAPGGSASCSQIGCPSQTAEETARSAAASSSGTSSRQPSSSTGSCSLGDPLLQNGFRRDHLRPRPHRGRRPIASTDWTASSSSGRPFCSASRATETTSCSPGSRPSSALVSSGVRRAGRRGGAATTAAPTRRAPSSRCPLLDVRRHREDRVGPVGDDPLQAGVRPRRSLRRRRGRCAA